MTQAQLDAERCGLIPEENPPEFVAQHLSAYAFMKTRVARKKVLEVGFGDGYGSAYLAETAEEVVGVDLVSGNIPRARAKYPRSNLSFQPFDGLHLPFPDGTFDAAGSFQVIEHIPEPQIIPWLAEIKRVLKPGGQLFVSTLNLDHNRKPGRPYEKLIYHEKEFTAPELESTLRAVFEKTTLYGVQPTLKHRLFRRLKRWGLRKTLPPPVNFVERYFQRMTVHDFVTTRSNVLQSIDLIALCQKP